MITIQVTNKKQALQFEHASGAIEFGRGPKRQCERFVVNDLFVSRDQLRIQEQPGNRIKAENLSSKQEVLLPDGSTINVGMARDIALPIRLVVGQTFLDIFPVTADALDHRTLSMLEQPASGVENSTLMLTPLRDLGDSPAPETLAHWLETVIKLQRSAEPTTEFYNQTALALVQLIGLDEGLILLRRDFHWEVVGRHPLEKGPPNFSRTLLSHVAAERRTFYQDLKKWGVQSESLRGIEAVVVSPIFGVKDEVVGALYGLRNREILNRGGIKALEAQVVQLLATNIGVNLARGLAGRNPGQFEQSFPPALAQELGRDPGMLEAREEEVTLLVSQLRGWPELARKLGPQKACQLARELMQRLGDRILEQTGVIVEMTGDSILAMWNAPKAQRDHALLASGAALGMLEEAHDLTTRWQEHTGAPLALNIGLHTGVALVGSVGSVHHFRYRPTGPVLDVVRRVQNATRRFGQPVLMTGAVQRYLPDTLATRRLCQARLLAGGEPLALYELHGVTASPDWLAARDTYESALMQYEFGQWSRACLTLLPLLQQADRQDHADAPTLQLMRLACACLETEPAQFDPVVDILDSK